ncbi:MULTISPECIES: flagellar hook-length control protein FliK [Hyphobacterium]|uniref:Flagellar hook-length control protein FliK n=1 Tax=Hyphobacterium vulgare TaxID=1736751 RepID=A0ABV6ZZP2_9PROT
MHADAYIPDFRATVGTNASGPDRRDARTGAGDTGFDALLNEPARSREAITDPRDRGIVPGGRGGQRQRPDTPFPDPSEPPRPVDGGGQPSETGVLLPETGGGLPPEQVVAGTPHPTGGGTPFGDGTAAPSTGGGLPFGQSDGPTPATGGPLPMQTATPAPATGGPQPAETGGPVFATGGGTPQQTATLDPSMSGGQPPEAGGNAPRTGGGLPAEQITPGPQASTGTPAETADPADVKPTAQAKQAGDAGKTAVQPQPAGQPAGNGPAAGQTGMSPGAGAGAGSTNTQAAAPAAPGPTAGTAPAITPEQAAAAAAAMPQESGRPRAILEKSAAPAPAGAAAKSGASAASPDTQAGSPAPAQAAVRPDRPVLPSQASDVARDALERLPGQGEAQRAAEPAALPESDFEAEMTVQRQAADVRSADATLRSQNAQGPRLPANAAPGLAAHIVRNFHQGQRQFEIRMDPPELGRVEVKLHVNSNDNRVHAVLSAERPETLADLQRSARELERALAEAGLDLSDNGLQFELSQGGDDTDDRFGTPRDGFAVYSDAAPNGAAADPAAGPMTRLYGFALSGGSGIDVRI